MQDELSIEKARVAILVEERNELLRKVFELEEQVRRLTKRAADECPNSSDGKHEFYQGSTWRICAHCGTRR